MGRELQVCCVALYLVYDKEDRQQASLLSPFHDQSDQKGTGLFSLWLNFSTELPVGRPCSTYVSCSPVSSSRKEQTLGF